MATNTWSGYPNGRIPLNLMVNFRGSGKYLQADAANWLDRLLRAATAAGHNFYVGAGEDLYRDFARQQYFWNNQKALGIVAAYPGTSNHGWGLAADVDGTSNTAAYAWLKANAPKFNYELGTVPSEKWHWLYIGPTTTTAGGGATPIPAPTVTEQDDDDDMKIVKYGTGAIVFDSVNKKYRYIENKVSTEYNLLVANPESRGVFFDTINQAYFTDLVAGFTRVW